jgi:hypothetical protein
MSDLQPLGSVVVVSTEFSFCLIKLEHPVIEIGTPDFLELAVVQDLYLVKHS